jgi:hypothetical protein
MKKKLMVSAAAAAVTAGLVFGATAPAYAGGGYYTTHSSCMGAYKSAQSAGVITSVITLCVYNADFAGFYTLHWV